MLLGLCRSGWRVSQAWFVAKNYLSEEPWLAWDCGIVTRGLGFVGALRSQGCALGHFLWSDMGAFSPRGIGPPADVGSVVGHVPPSQA